MKKVTFKKEFNSLEEALTKVPKVLKEDMNVFQMTDGNQTIKVRWEGTLTEGKAVALINEDKKMISEDMSHMKHLMGYKSEETLGNVKGVNRVDENETFKGLLKKKSITEGEILEEGKMANIMAGLAMFFGVTAMAQENPEKAKEVIKDKVEMSTDEDRAQIEKQIGFKMDDEVFNRLFQKKREYDDIQKLDLGKYGHVVELKNQHHNSKEGGAPSYEIDISSQGHIDHVIKDIKQRNNIPGATVKVYYRGGHHASKDFTL